MTPKEKQKILSNLKKCEHCTDGIADELCYPHICEYCDGTGYENLRHKCVDDCPACLIERIKYDTK